MYLSKSCRTYSNKFKITQPSKNINKKFGISDTIQFPAKRGKIFTQILNYNSFIYKPSFRIFYPKKYPKYYTK